MTVSLAFYTQWTLDARARSTTERMMMTARARERDETGDDDPSTSRTVETTANTRRRDAATQAFGDFDDALDDRARDAMAETLVDMKLTKRVVGQQDTSPVACAHERVDDDEGDETRYCRVRDVSRSRARRLVSTPLMTARK
jgi:hypothetical protein